MGQIKDTVSVHRLIQSAYHDHRKRKDQVAGFIRAARLLHRAFPQQDKGFALFNRWVECERLLEHVESLCDRYRAIFAMEQPDYTEEFLYLLSNCGR